MDEQKQSEQPAQQIPMPEFRVSGQGTYTPPPLPEEDKK